MRGLPTPLGGWPRPRRLAIRLLLIAPIALWSLHAFECRVIESLTPAYSVVIKLFGGPLELERLEPFRNAETEGLLARFNLAEPTEIAGKTVYPFGWYAPPGGYMPAGAKMPDGGPVPLGVFQGYCPLTEPIVISAWALILVLTWPASDVKQMAIRLVTLSPFLVVLVIIDVPSAILGTVWETLSDAFDPRGFYPWCALDAFLVGGGGAVLGVVAAGFAIFLGHRLSSLTNTRSWF